MKDIKILTPKELSAVCECIKPLKKAVHEAKHTFITSDVCDGFFVLEEVNGMISLSSYNGKEAVWGVQLDSSTHKALKGKGFNNRSAVKSLVDAIIITVKLLMTKTPTPIKRMRFMLNSESEWDLGFITPSKAESGSVDILICSNTYYSDIRLKFADKLLHNVTVATKYTNMYGYDLRKGYRDCRLTDETVDKEYGHIIRDYDYENQLKKVRSMGYIEVTDRDYIEERYVCKSWSSEEEFIVFKVERDEDDEWIFETDGLFGASVNLPTKSTVVGDFNVPIYAHIIETMGVYVKYILLYNKERKDYYSLVIQLEYDQVIARNLYG